MLNLIPLALNPLPPAPTCFNASNVYFSNLNFPCQLILSNSYHRTIRFMKQSPRSIIVANPKNSFQTEGDDSMPLACHKVYGKKPCPQWFVRLMKQSSRGNGCLTFTFLAKKDTTSNQKRLFSNTSTTVTTETFW